MTLLNLALVALIQGLTEFLPVSSSAHLILLPALTGLEDQGLLIDVAVHVGSLFAVMLYFRREVASAVAGVPDLLSGRLDSPGAFLALCLVVATIPVVIAGGILKITGAVDLMRSVAVIGWAMILFGIVLYVADQRGAETRELHDWNLRDAIILGLWQAVALIPGTSRAGIVISGARWHGYTRRDAARISMLMSIPTIIASGVLLGADVAMQMDAEAAIAAAIGAAMAFLAALASLALMMKLLESVNFTPYVIYRMGLGAVLLWIAYA